MNRYNASHTVEAGQSVTLLCCDAACVAATDKPFSVVLKFNSTLAIGYYFGFTDIRNGRCRFSDDLSSVIVDDLLVTYTTDDFVCSYHANHDDTDIYTHYVQVYSK